MGLLGQGVRAVVGLKSMTDDARAVGVSPADFFQAARLLTSLMIGVIVGLAEAIVYMANAGAPTLDWHVLLGFAATAYAGTDFLEGFISSYLSSSALTKTSLSSAEQFLPVTTALVRTSKVDDATAFVIGVINKLRGDGRPLPINNSTILKLTLASLGWNDAGSDQVLAAINDAKWHNVTLAPGSINSALTIQQIIDAVTAAEHLS
jgi:hypothetical protein